MSKKHFFKEVDKKDNSGEFYSENMSKIWRSWTTVHHDEGGYVEYDVNFIFFTDGSFAISDNDGDSFVSFAKEELQDLISIIGFIQNDSKD